MVDRVIGRMRINESNLIEIKMHVQCCKVIILLFYNVDWFNEDDCIYNDDINNIW